MEYRKLGKSGLQLSALSLGSWLTFGNALDLKGVKESIALALDHGINFFDNAEIYGNGSAELLMGEALRSYPREDLVISTKIFWGGEGPNQTGLNWKHMVEGTKNSLRRLQLEYVDLLFCHRPDPETPIEETLRAIQTLIDQGLVFYWGTSEWDAKDIAEAYTLAHALHLTPPTMEQPEYNLYARSRVEEEYSLLYRKYGLGTTTWSPLASGILTGKYNDGIPEGTRFHKERWLRESLTKEKIEQAKKFAHLAKNMGCTSAQLAIAWCLKNPSVSSVILGISNPQQLTENLKALPMQKLLTEEVMTKLDTIFPKSLVSSTL